MKTSNKTNTAMKPVTMTMMTILMMKKTLMMNTIKLMMTNSKTELKMKDKKSIPSSVHKKMLKAVTNDKAKGENKDKETAVISEQEMDLQGSELRRSTRES
jgi:hypothetical protein